MKPRSVLGLPIHVECIEKNVNEHNEDAHPEELCKLSGPWVGIDKSCGFPGIKPIHLILHFIPNDFDYFCNLYCTLFSTAMLGCRMHSLRLALVLKNER